MAESSLPSSAASAGNESAAAAAAQQWRDYCSELLEDRRLLLEDLAVLTQCADEVETIVDGALRDRDAAEVATEARLTEVCERARASTRATNRDRRHVVSPRSRRAIG